MTQSAEIQRNVFGLTGGVGSGKSTVSAGLREYGAVILDADAIVHDLQRPGQPLLSGMANILGEHIIEDSGELNRSAAASVIFSNPDKRKAIDSLIHPLVWQQIDEDIEQASPDDLVVLDVPLLLNTKQPRQDLRGIMVVDTPPELAIDRLVSHRGFTPETAQARIDAQMSREERLAHADFVISNHGTQEELAKEIKKAVGWMRLRAKIGEFSTRLMEEKA